MITKRHKYRGKIYQPGDDFTDQAHENWATNPVRNYGFYDRRKYSAEQKPAKRSRKATGKKAKDAR